MKPSPDKRHALELPPCPHCGKVAPVVHVASTMDDMDEYEREHGHPEGWTVVCDAATERNLGGCGASSGYRFSPEEAVQAWKQRFALSHVAVHGKLDDLSQEREPRNPMIEKLDAAMGSAVSTGAGTNSETPRTDAFYKDRFKAPDAIDFARQLERELAVKTAEAEHHFKSFQAQSHARSELQAASSSTRLSDRCEKCPWPNDGCISPRCGMNGREVVERMLVKYALDLFAETGSAAFKVPVPNTTPPLFIMGGEERQFAASAIRETSDTERLDAMEGAKFSVMAYGEGWSYRIERGPNSPWRFKVGGMAEYCEPFSTAREAADAARAELRRMDGGKAS